MEAAEKLLVYCSILVLETVTAFNFEGKDMFVYETAHLH
jgi:hypothetical protein